MFYFDKDKKEIREWIQESATANEQNFNIKIDNLHSIIKEIKDIQDALEPASEVERRLRVYIEQNFLQLQQQFAQIEERFSSFQQQIEESRQQISQSQQQNFQSNVNVKNKLSALQRKIDNEESFKKQVISLKNEVDKLKSSPDIELKNQVETLKKEVYFLKLQPDTNAELNEQIENLKQEISQLNQNNDSLTAELEKVRYHSPSVSQIPDADSDSDSDISPDEIFRIDEPAEIFITDRRSEISEKIKRILSVEDLKMFLTEHDNETSQKLLRLIDVHLNLAKGFIKNLNFKHIDDDELSENVTVQYFKIFRNVIFDNMMIVIRRCINEDEIYLDFLKKLNNYLLQCGIYSFYVTAERLATDDDYKNMTPQIIKTDDLPKNGVIAEIERLPYRINYLNEFGEKKFLQYNGLMTVCKAV